MCTAAQYERTTGRTFYGLAGYSYTSPESGFKWHPGGEAILHRVLLTPSKVVLGALLVSAFVAVGIGREAPPWFPPAAFLLHVISIIAFVVYAVRCYVLLTGVFV